MKNIAQELQKIINVNIFKCLIMVKQAMQLRADAVHAFTTFSHYTEITQMAVVLAVVVVVTGILHMFKQPTIIGYLVAGILL